MNGSQAKGTVQIREINRIAVLRAILVDKATSRADIAHITGLSQSTVTRVVNGLLQEGLVREVGISLTGSRGSPPSILSFCGDLAYIVGIDVGESFIRYEMSNLTGDFRGEHEKSTRAIGGGNVTYEQLVAGYFEMLRAHNISDKSVWCVCVGIPGVVASDEGTVTVPDIDGWWRYPLGAKLREAIGTNVRVENASNCSIMGEHAYGCAQDVENAVFMNLRAGIGGGVMLDGRLYRGHSNAAGEFGFLLPTADYPPIPDRKRGAMERQAGIYAIMEKLNEHHVGVVGEDSIPYMHSICQLAADGDALARQVLEANTLYYTQIAVAVVATLNPELLVIGGDVLPVGEELVRRIREGVRAFTPYPPRVELTALGARAPLKGALSLASERALARLGILR